MRATEIGPDLFEQVAAQQRVADAQERTEARVQRHPDEEAIITDLQAYAYKVAAARYTQMGEATWSADDLGRRLDLMGVPRENNTRRRLVSVAANRGRREGRWRVTGQQKGLAGRFIATWTVELHWKPKETP